MTAQPPGLSDAQTLFPLDEAEPMALPAGKLPSYIADHRARLRARFTEAGRRPCPTTSFWSFSCSASSRVRT